jgi:hypothetical protein
VEAKKRSESTAGYGVLFKDLSGRKAARDEGALASIVIAPLACLDLPIPNTYARTADGDSGDICVSCGRENRSNYAFCRQCGQNSKGAPALDAVETREPLPESAGPGQLDEPSVPLPSGEFTASSGTHRPWSGRTQWSPRRRRRRWVIALFGTAALALSGGVWSDFLEIPIKSLESRRGNTCCFVGHAGSATGRPELGSTDIHRQRSIGSTQASAVCRASRSPKSKRTTRFEWHFEGSGRPEECLGTAAPRN